jgi:mercuric ion binding protein
MRLSWTSLALAVLLAGNFAAASDDVRTVTFRVDKMTCAACPLTVRKAMNQVDGVKDVKVDFDSKTAIVTYDRNRTTVAEIGGASTNVGFPVNVIAGDDE